MELMRAADPCDELRLNKPVWVRCRASHLARRAPSASADLPSDKGRLGKLRTRLRRGRGDRTDPGLNQWRRGGSPSIPSNEHLCSAVSLIA